MGRRTPKTTPVPTKVSLVFDAMVRMDDFVTTTQLRMLLHPACKANHITAALVMLKRYHAVDCVEAGGRLWWYATPSTDTRSKVLEQRRPEDQPRRRASKKLPGATLRD